MVATETNSARSPKGPRESATIREKDLTVSQKAQSLESKDPAWFKQTEDRGIGSAAYRKTQESSPGMVNGSVRLPGLSRESSIEPERDTIAEQQTSSTPSWDGSVRGSASLSQKTTSTRPSSTAKSPLPLLLSQRLKPPTENTAYDDDNVLDRSPAMSPSQGRISPDRMDRPASPTKGLGGFVQSAMLKRSDSVNKRWSAQAAPGLSRGNSMAGNRNGHDVPRPFTVGIGPGLSSGSGFSSKASSLSRETSPVSTSRPGSSHSTSTVTQQPKEGAINTIESQSRIATSNEFVKPTLPDQNRSQALQPQSDHTQTKYGSSPSTPSSPSKVTDSKRWSPTKASWLESAINKPDSPKPKPAAPQQPSWMADLQKAKQKRGSVDFGKPVGHKEVSVGGLLRSPTMGSTMKSPSLGDITGVPSTQSGQPSSGFERTLSFPESKLIPEPGGLSSSDSIATTSKPLGSPTSSPATAPPPSTKFKDQMSNSALSSKGESEWRVPTINKPKPITPPKKDFRSTLKARQVSNDKSQSNEPEFKNVFGKLKKTETKNYVAPDELKDNILRGKAGLALTGGPKRTERRDDFKDSILKKKEEMKVMGGGSIKGKPPVKAPSEAIVPEAITKRRGLGTKSETSDTSQSQETGDSLPAKNIDNDDISRMAVPEKKISAPARLQEATISSGSLANRFNPALAGVLARGPSLAIGSATLPRTNSPTEIEDFSAGSKASQLTHATKSRARGPKRRLPTSMKAEDAPKTKASLESQSKVLEDSPNVIADPVAAPRHTNANPILRPLPSKPVIASGSEPQPHPEHKTSTKSLQPEVPKPSNHLNIRQVLPLTPQSPWTVGSKPVTTEAIIPPANDKSPKKTVGLGITSQISDNGKIKPPAKSPRSPPIPAKKSEALSRIVSNGSLAPQSPPKTPTGFTPKSSRATTLFTNFFDNEPDSKGKVDIDTQAVLTKTVETASKIKTLRKEIWEITGDGKKTPVPLQQEHILYEDCMYLCSHVFGTFSGKKTTEVYLWCGDGVSSSSIEDAQLFCRNTAKDAGGKLIILRQGKESSTFFEALGGIVITRRGSSNDSSATYMLCGRRHMSQIAFDEVEFSPKSLCSGFPFIIAATGGSLYLWKGKGASADELGCARLIGMDLGLTGEIEEIDEGNESDSFWKAFRTSDRPDQVAEHWSVKASSNKYATRLFSVDVDARPKSNSGFMWGRRTSTPSTEDSLNAQVKEISPYSQSDLLKDGVFVLDAYFEIYV